MTKNAANNVENGTFASLIDSVDDIFDEEYWRFISSSLYDVIFEAIKSFKDNFLAPLLSIQYNRDAIDMSVEKHVTSPSNVWKEREDDLIFQWIAPLFSQRCLEFLGVSNDNNEEYASFKCLFFSISSNSCQELSKLVIYPYEKESLCCGASEDALIESLLVSYCKLLSDKHGSLPSQVPSSNIEAQHKNRIFLQSIESSESTRLYYNFRPKPGSESHLVDIMLGQGIIICKIQDVLLLVVILPLNQWMNTLADVSIANLSMWLNYGESSQIEVECSMAPFQSLPIPLAEALQASLFRLNRSFLNNIYDLLVPVEYDMSSNPFFQVLKQCREEMQSNMEVEIREACNDSIPTDLHEHHLTDDWVVEDLCSTFPKSWKTTITANHSHFAPSSGKEDVKEDIPNDNPLIPEKPSLNQLKPLQSKDTNQSPVDLSIHDNPLIEHPISSLFPLEVSSQIPIANKDLNESQLDMNDSIEVEVGPSTTINSLPTQAIPLLLMSNYSMETWEISLCFLHQSVLEELMSVVAPSGMILASSDLTPSSSEANNDSIIMGAHNSESINHLAHSLAYSWGGITPVPPQAPRKKKDDQRTDDLPSFRSRRVRKALYS